MTVAKHTERVSALGVGTAALTAAGRLAKAVSSRRMGPDGTQLGVSDKAEPQPDVGRMQGSSLRGAITLTVQRKLPQQSADQVMTGDIQKSPSCEKRVLPEQGLRGANDPVPADIDAGGASITTQAGRNGSAVDNFCDFRALASSSNSAEERSGTVRTAGGCRNSSSSRSDGETSSASASASRQRLSLRHACHPQSSQYGTPPALMSMEPEL